MVGGGRKGETGPMIPKWKYVSKFGDDFTVYATYHEDEETDVTRAGEEQT